MGVSGCGKSSVGAACAEALGWTLHEGDAYHAPDSVAKMRAGTPLTQNNTRFKLLGCLMRNSPNVVPRVQLEREVWGDDPPDSDALRTHIHALRQALDKPFTFPMLLTVQGIGFKLVDADPGDRADAPL